MSRPLAVTVNGPACPTCSQPLSWESPGVYSCSICTIAVMQGKSIEEVRAEIEDLARSFTARFGSATGNRCTCGAGSGGYRVVDHRDASAVGFIDMDVEHKPDCALGVQFEWGPIDEDWRAFDLENRPVRDRRPWQTKR